MMKKYSSVRDQFDIKLIEQVAERGGTVLPRSKCVDFQYLENKNWLIKIKHAEKGEFNIQADYLIDATGRAAHVCRKIGVPSKKHDSLMAVGTFLSFDTEPNSKREQILEATELGWWYTAQLPNNKMVITLFTDADIISENKLHQANDWNYLLSSTKKVKYLANGATALSKKPWVRNAQTQITDPTSIDHFMAIGDAASSFDPISSMGIGFSITSAFHAAKHIQSELSQNKVLTTNSFQKDIEQNFERYLKIRKHYYQQEKRWASSPFWKRRNSIENQTVPNPN